MPAGECPAIAACAMVRERSEVTINNGKEGKREIGWYSHELTNIIVSKVDS